MPTRTRSRSEDLAVGVGVVDQFGSPIRNQSFGTTTVSSTQQSTTDVVTPGWLSKLQDGQVLMNPFSSSKVTIEDDKSVFALMIKTQNGSLWRYRDGSVSSWRFMGQPYPSLVTLPASNEITLREQAISAAFAKASEAEALVLASLAELQKTADTIVDCIANGAWLLKQFTDKYQRLLTIKRMRDGRLLRGFNSRKALETSRQLWLTYRYGIRPLVYDVRNLIDAMTSIGTQRKLRFTSTKTEVKENTVIQNKGFEYVLLRNVLNRTRTTKCTAGVLVEYDMTNSMKSFDAFGAQKILSTQWELVPYSFVADWFMSTADFVASWEPPVGNVVGTWVTTRVTDHFTAQCNREDILPSLPAPWTTVLGIRRLRYQSVTESRVRTPNPARPVLPSWKLRLNTSKVVDIMALLGNLTAT